MSLDLTRRSAPFVIAEAGTCHTAPDRAERLRKALAYVAAAAEAGADAIKFQVFANPIAADMFCWIDGDEARATRWEQTALSFTDWHMVKASAEVKGLVFLASAFQHSTVEWMSDLGVVASKVASRAAKTFPYWAAPSPWLISTGMGLPPENVMQGAGAVLLECEANYPSTSRWVGRYPGFSDHSGMPALAIDAMRRGCRLVEVHFFIASEDAGPDVPASLTVQQLKEVTAVRDEIAAAHARRTT